MVKILLYCNAIKKEAVDLSEKVISFLNKKEKVQILNIDEKSDADMTIAIGGDGTIIDAWHELPYKPIFGINCGHLGYMTCSTKEDWQEKLELVLDDKFTVVKRDTLKIIARKMFYNTIAFRECSCAINDVVLCKQKPGVIRFDIEVNHSPLMSMAADGLICATPNGSTAYAFSAGGALIDPNSHVLQLIGIAPHTLLNRSVILNGDNLVTLKMHEDSANADLIVDGKKVKYEVSGDLCVDIELSNDKFLKLFTFETENNFARKIYKLAELK